MDHNAYQNKTWNTMIVSVIVFLLYNFKSIIDKEVLTTQ